MLNSTFRSSVGESCPQVRGARNDWFLRSIDKFFRSFLKNHRIFRMAVALFKTPRYRYRMMITRLTQRPASARYRRGELNLRNINIQIGQTTENSQNNARSCTLCGVLVRRHGSLQLYSAFRRPNIVIRFVIDG